MKKIVLLCAAGMSTSMLVNKMVQEAEKENYECTINAYAISTAAETGADADIILLGPQVRFHKEEVEKECPGVPVECIDMQAYGTLNGKKVLDSVHRVLGD